MPKYKSVVYGEGFSLHVEPIEKAHEVLHYFLTGHLFMNRSLDGVKVTVDTNEKYAKICKKRAKELSRSMRESKELI